MSKRDEFLNRFGANLAESMGAGRRPGQGGASQAERPAGPSQHEGTSRLRTAVEIEVDRIEPDPDQPRQDFDPGAIARLAASIQSHGQLQPIAVRWSPDRGRYIIVAGERRWRASRHAGRARVAAVIIEGERTREQILEMQLIENCIREDLKPVEQARTFKALIDANGWTASRLAEELHLTGASVSRALALLELPTAVQGSVDGGQLAPSIAYEISKVEDAAEQEALAAEVVAGKLNRAETAEAVRRRKAAGQGGRRAARGKARKVTTQTYRTPSGCKITVENRKGIEPGMIVAALREVADQVEAAATPSAEAA
jgi:ParB family chromosome partitioning protein